MSENVWEPGADGGPVQGASKGALPPATAVITATIEDVKQHFGGMFAAGAGFFVLMFAMIVAVLAAMALPVIPGVVTENETLLMGGFAVGMSLYIVLLLGLSLVITPMMMGSFYRAAALQSEGGVGMGFGTPWRSWTENMGKMVLAYFIYQVIVLIGMLFCYVPGLIAAMVFAVVPALVAVRNVPPMEAFSMTMAHIQDNPGWHLAVGAIGFFSMMILMYIPFVGMFLAYPFVATYHVHTMRMAFEGGDS